MRREAPCVAYELETEVRFWKAERPTPRRVDIFVRGLRGTGLEALDRESGQDYVDVFGLVKVSVTYILPPCLHTSRLYSSRTYRGIPSPFT